MWRLGNTEAKVEGIMHLSMGIQRRSSSLSIVELQQTNVVKFFNAVLPFYCC